MMKDIKYIIKRVIIGVAIAFIIMFARSYVFADSIYSAQVSCSGSYGCSQSFGSTTGSIRFGDNFGIFTDKTGYLYGSFGIVRDTYTESRPIVSVRYVIAFTSNGVYNCDFGSTSQNVSQYVGWSYSYTCPVSTGSGGVSYIQVGLSSVQGGSSATYYNISFSDRFSFSIPTDNTGIEVRLDSVINALTASANSTASAINSQTTTIIQQEQATQSAINSNTQSVQQNTQAVDNFKNAIMSTDTTQAQTDGNSLFNDFIEDSNLHGLSGVVSAPFALLNGLTSGTCQPLQFTLPFVHNQVTLPCMSTIYSTYFGAFFTIYQLLISGVLFYMIYINYVRVMKNLQNPYDDRIEVFSL